MNEGRNTEALRELDPRRQVNEEAEVRAVFADPVVTAPPSSTSYRPTATY